MDRENIKRGSFLKLLRTSNHMSERDLAEILDVEPSDITVWETGIKFPEDSATIDKLAKLFHVSKRELLNGEYRKDKVTEVEYKEKKTVDDDYTLSNTGKNILIVILSCVILLIIFVSIISLTTTVNKKVNINPQDYYVSDERDEVIHTPNTINESIVRNTVALSQKRTYNADALLNYGFAKNGNLYSKTYGHFKITYQDEVFTLVYTYRGYKEMYEKGIDSRIAKVQLFDDDFYSSFEEKEDSITRDCTKRSCICADDYLQYINFLSDRIRE